jgi:hypothetical protein
MSGDTLNELTQMIKAPDISEELKVKYAKDISKNLRIKAESGATYIIVIAVDNDGDSNFINRINCRKGLPIGGYIYDSQSDCYYVDCADFLHLGSISVSYSMTVAGDDNWKQRVLMPEVVIKRFMSPLQKRELKNFQKRFKAPKFKINFIQMVDPNK